LRVQPQAEPLGQIDSIGSDSPSSSRARSSRASITISAPSILTSPLPGRSRVLA